MPIPPSEADLYPPVKRFLERQGYLVKGEIGACDVLAVRDHDPPVVVELKRAFSLELLFQGVDRQQVTDAVYLAFPPPKRARLAGILGLCRRLGLGVLLVTGRTVEPALDPSPYRPRKLPKRRTALLREFARRVGDTESGGSAARPRMTAYRQDALRLAAALGPEGAAKVRDLKSATGVEKAGPMLLTDVYGWFQRRERGVYALSPKGRVALIDHSAAIASISAEYRKP